MCIIDVGEAIEKLNVEFDDFFNEENFREIGPLVTDDSWAMPSNKSKIEGKEGKFVPSNPYSE